jgi:acetate kinase
MGLTPLEGLIMGTRSGDMDPAILQYISHKEGTTIDDLLTMLNKQSGMLGISGVSSDFRDVKKAENEGNHRAKVANEMFVYRVAKYIGAYTAAMNGVDAITFTAGVGENDSLIRSLICGYLSYLGVKIDEEQNKVRGKEALISSPDSKVKVYVLPTNEELSIAQQTLELVAK